MHCSYNDALRTLFVQCTQPRYCDLSTNTMRRYWSWILLWQYYLSLPDIGMYFSVNTMHKSSMELIWKYGRLSSIPFLKSSIPFHSGIFHIPYRNFRSIPFHFPFHSIPCPESNTVLLTARHRCNIYLKEAVLLTGAMKRGWAPPTRHMLRPNNTAIVRKDLMWLALNFVMSQHYKQYASTATKSRA